MIGVPGKILCHHFRKTREKNGPTGSGTAAGEVLKALWEKKHPFNRAGQDLFR
ncbi:conserved domain protein [delta proteobacterium NaphS2]|nr:conserved domain protein [delta proteobacterium NaphS2]